MSSAGASPNAKRTFYGFDVFLMNYYLQQKSQHFEQIYFQNPMNQIQQMLFCNQCN